MDSDEEAINTITSAVLNAENAISPPEKKRRLKPHVISAWTPEEVHSLIQAVEEHPCIWQYSSAEYKNRVKREQAWFKIQEKTLCHSIDDCKAKWANVKTAYQNVKKKMVTKSGQAANSTQPHWPFWSAMQFYYHHDTSKTTSSICTLSNSELLANDFSGDTSTPSSSSPKDYPTKAAPKLSSQTTNDDMMKRAIKCLEQEDDQWSTIGVYLASQLREVSKINEEAAHQLHLSPFLLLLKKQLIIQIYTIGQSCDRVAAIIIAIVLYQNMRR